jgi:putative PIN family toxin of toxin-antitoxin system
MRVYLDTNVLVSAFSTRGLCADLVHAVLAEHELLIGPALLGEVRRVLRTKMRVGAEALAEVEALLVAQGTMPPKRSLTKPLPAIRDADDRVILAEAVAGSADVFVTGDRHLLDVAARSPVPIVTPRGLWEMLRQQPTGS